MLNIAIRNQIPSSTIRLLYDTRMVIDEPEIRNKVNKVIKDLRVKYKESGTDNLLDKAVKYRDPKQWDEKRFSHEKRCVGRHVAGAFYKEKCKEWNKVMYLEKKPPMAFYGEFRSIEFELIFKSKDAQDEFVNLARCRGFKNALTIHEDASLRRNANDERGIPKEVVFSYRKGEEDKVRSICSLLRGRAYVNNTCGTHFHFDMRHVDGINAKMFGERLARAVPALRLLLPASRRANKYCKDAINSGVDDVQHRRAFINLAAYAKHRTIEVRGHSGTIIADKILNWISLCEKIMNTPFTAENQFAGTSASTPDDLIKQYALDDKLKEYVLGRYAIFNTSAEVGEGEEKVADPEPPPIPAQPIVQAPGIVAPHPAPDLAPIDIPPAAFDNAHIINMVVQ